MHELGIIVHVMRTVEEVAAENNLTEIRSVTCEIGEVSGVVPEYMTDCWGYARSRSELLKDSELKIEIIPGVTMCEDCGKPIPQSSMQKYVHTVEAVPRIFWKETDSASRRLKGHNKKILLVKTSLAEYNLLVRFFY